MVPKNQPDESEQTVKVTAAGAAPGPQVMVKPLPLILDEMEINIRKAEEAAEAAREASAAAARAAKEATTAAEKAAKDATASAISAAGRAEEMAKAAIRASEKAAQDAEKSFQTGGRCYSAR